MWKYEINIKQQTHDKSWYDSAKLTETQKTEILLPVA